MKKKKNKVLNFFMAYILFIICTTIITLLILNTILVPTYIQENNLINLEYKEKVLNEIEQIAFNISSSHEYIKNKYDCKSFSRDLVLKLKENNISAYCVFGWYNKTNLHIWVQTIIDNETYNIEATSGFFIADEEYQTLYKELKKGFCYK